MPLFIIQGVFSEKKDMMKKNPKFSLGVCNFLIVYISRKMVEEK